MPDFADAMTTSITPSTTTWSPFTTVAPADETCSLITTRPPAIAIVWFGLGTPTVVFIIWNSVFFLIFANTVLGVRSVATVLEDGVRTLGG